MSFEDDANPWGASSGPGDSPELGVLRAKRRVREEEKEELELGWSATVTATSTNGSASSEHKGGDQGALNLDNLEDDTRQMDEFEVDDGAAAETNENDAQLDDFGSVKDEHDEDDDDFGDFGDDLDDGGFDDFEQAGPVAGSSAAQPEQRVPTRTPAFQFEARRSREEIEQQLRPLLDVWSPGAYDTVSDEPERQVQGTAQVLVSESSRTLLSSLSSLPTLRPLDWKRSRIRREHLIALGVPVNLDDSATSAPLASLVLPPVNPRPASPVPPPPRSSASTPIGRTATPPLGPMFDQSRAEQLLSLSEPDLQLMTLDRLKQLQSDLVRTSSDASHALTSALLAREQQVTDAEAYHVMIQDLVAAASKLKTSSMLLGAGGAGGASVSRKSSGSSTSRWSSARRSSPSLR